MNKLGALYRRMKSASSDKNVKCKKYLTFLISSKKKKKGLFVTSLVAQQVKYPVLLVL